LKQKNTLEDAADQEPVGLRESSRKMDKFRPDFYGFEANSRAI
jgi:hypothetical protein